MNKPWISKTIALLALASAGTMAGEAQAPDPAALLGGAASTDDASERAYLRPVAALDAAQAKRFKQGHEGIDAKWKFYWFEAGEWGMGPTSNAAACGECHVRNGRGAPNASGASTHSMIVRVSLPGTGEYGGPKPHPNYGDQIQTIGVPGVVDAEAAVDLQWTERPVTLDDGEIVTLRQPSILLRDPKYGALGADLLLSPRVPPALVGMGLLDAVPEQALRALAARDPGDGIRGRVNEVWDYARQAVAVGRFGHKAGTPSLRQQVAAAFWADIGVSSDYFPEQNCPGVQAVCRQQMTAGKPELGKVRWDAIEFHLRAAAVPLRREVRSAHVERGERLFLEAKCVACHVESLETGEVPGLPALSHQVIRPYTDLLLHDMGEGLADGRPEYRAGGRDWRTPPLWGIGLSGKVNGVETYLHDGRARSIAEAILWHGGEAAVSSDAYRRMPKADRQALEAFVRSL